MKTGSKPERRGNEHDKTDDSFVAAYRYFANAYHRIVYPSRGIGVYQHYGKIALVIGMELVLPRFPIASRDLV